ncbi:MAG: L-lactate dehydrogenase 2 [Candidatus Scalindua sp.]|nr:malate dehydrogenase [Planctomycetota bacterium]RZV92410.1 MAG: malate dehydrogenase [Candidatus Scalindua sp. SCAELEC01]GJQ59036.1 MAG: L-lactate dehydrogenase 2 [Candidatus Scalindua sp.]
MNIAVIGASGSIGSELARRIIATRLLEHNERLQLVGREGGPSSHILYGLSTDLMDAYDEICPTVEVILDPKDISADLIIMAAGTTAPSTHSSPNPTRDSLAKKNIPIFEYYASVLSRHGHGNEIVICVSNPNELNVEIFARHLDRKRVIGMGAYLDSLRFRKEIAQDLCLHRQKIHGFMVGEHGSNMVPLWSNVHVYGFKKDALKMAIDKIRKGYATVNFPEDIARARDPINTLIQEGNVRRAYDLANQYPPDLRTVLKPDITHFSGSKTVTGTVNATLELVNTITMGHDTFISGQIKLEGEFYGIYGTIGVPFLIGNCGVEKVLEIPLEREEKQLLIKNAKNINQKICQWLAT